MLMPAGGQPAGDQSAGGAANAWTLTHIGVCDSSAVHTTATIRASKGTLKFPLRKPVPYDLIARVVQLLVKQRAGDGDPG